jgi:hypothetical protein
MNSQPPAARSSILKPPLYSLEDARMSTTLAAGAVGRTGLIRSRQLWQAIMQSMIAPWEDRRGYKFGRAKHR